MFSRSDLHEPFEHPSYFVSPGPFAFPFPAPQSSCCALVQFQPQTESCSTPFPPFFFFFLAASGFSYSEESLLQLVNFSLLVTPGLSCPSACGILVPQPGIEPASSALQGGFLTTGPPGKSQHHFPLEALGFPLSATTPAQLIYLVDCLLPRGPAKSRPCKLTSRSHHRNSTPKRPWSKLTSQGFISIS